MMPAEKFDPKLRLAMEEIKAILAKYDCAATITLQSGQHAEYLYHFSPTWSCVTLTDTGHCRVKCKREDFKDEASAKLCLEYSIGMFVGFLDFARKTTEDMTQLLRMVGKTVPFVSRNIES